jgi:hypothetical protein
MSAPNSCSASRQFLAYAIVVGSTLASMTIVLVAPCLRCCRATADRSERSCE